MIILTARSLKELLKTVKCQRSPWRNASQKLVEVGKFTDARNGAYEAGQLFFHKVFAYRGVVLFPWTTKVHDRDLVSKKAKVKEGGGDVGVPKDEVKSHKDTFYQVLMDSRDTPYIRSQAEAVTFLGSDEGKNAIFVVPGLDYVSQKDILPYETTDRKPIHHDLFDKFFSVASKTSGFGVKDSLKAWTKKNKSLLGLSEVHSETTDQLRVTVIPFFMGERETPGQPKQFWWRYCVRLENFGGRSLQLRERTWRLFSLSGTLETVRGRGVIGSEPVLSKERPAFQYSSHVSLSSPTGHMWGTFKMEAEDGSVIHARIPPFPLQSAISS